VINLRNGGSVDQTEGRISDLEVRVMRLEGKVEETRQKLILLEEHGSEAYHDLLSGIIGQLGDLATIVSRLTTLIEG